MVVVTEPTLTQSRPLTHRTRILLQMVAKMKKLPAPWKVRGIEASMRKLTKSGTGPLMVCGLDSQPL